MNNAKNVENNGKIMESLEFKSSQCRGGIIIDSGELTVHDAVCESC